VQDSEPANEPLNDLAKNLRSLQPAAVRTSEREIWYQAGVEAGRRRASVWRAAAAALAIVTAGVVVWHARPARAPVEQVVRVSAAPPVAPSQVAASPDAYARLRDAILQHGLDGLPPPDFAAGGDPSRRNAHPTFAPDEVSPLRLPVDSKG